MSNDRNQVTGNRLTEQTTLASSVLASASVQPRITSVVDNDGPSNTYVRNQGSTDDSTPLLRGWGEPGATLTITKSTDANDVLGTVTVDKNGMWSYQVSADNALADGGYTLIARQFNDAGQQISRSEPFFVNVVGGNVAGAEVEGAAKEAVAADVEAASAPEQPRITFVLDNDGPEGNSLVGNGRSTDDNTPLLRGRGEPGATLTITKSTDVNDVLGTAVVDKDGNWEYQVQADAALGNGGYTFIARQFNDAGDQITRSEPYFVTVDVADPNAPVSAPTIDVVYDNQVFNPAAPNGGWEAIANGQSSADRTPYLQGRGEAYATLTISYGDQVLGTVTVDRYGNWQYQVPENDALESGKYEFTASQVSQAGVSSPASEAYIVTIVDAPPLAAPVIDAVYDNVSPNGAWEEIANGQSSDDRTPLLVGRGVAGATLTISYGDQVLGTVTVGRYGDWQYQVKDNAPLENGKYEFTASQVNQAGASSPASEAYVVTITDAVVVAPPAPTIDVIYDNVSANGAWEAVANGQSSDDRTPYLQGRGQAGATLTISYGDQVLGTVTVGRYGDWQYQVKDNAPLENGKYEFTASQVNQAGASSPASEAYVVTITDAVVVAPPAPTIDVIYDNVSANGAWEAVANGQSSDDRTPYLQGRGQAGATLTISYGDQVLGTVTVGRYGDWQYQVKDNAPLENGKYEFTASQVNQAGASSPASEAYVVTITDAAVVAPPAPTIDAVSDNAVFDSSGQYGGWEAIGNGESSADRTPYLSGRGEANATVTISNGDQILGTVVADRYGSWQFEVPADAPLVNGTYEFVASQVNQAGVQSPESQAYVVTITDAPTPPAPIIDGVYDNVTSNGDWEEVANGQSSDDRTPLLAGRGEAYATLTISYGDQVLGTVTVDRSGNWQYQVPENDALGNATYEFTVSQVSVYGQPSPSSQPYVVTVTDVAPQEPVIRAVYDNENGGEALIADGQSTGDRTPYLLGTGEVGATLSISNGDDVLGTAIVDRYGNWEFEVPQSKALENGTYQLTASQVDASGEPNLPSQPYVVTVDAAPDAATTSIVADIASLDMSALDAGNAVHAVEDRTAGGDALKTLTLSDLLALDTQEDLMSGTPELAWLSQATGNQLSLEDVASQMDVSPDAITTGGVEHSYSFSVSNEFDLHVQELATQAG